VGAHILSGNVFQPTALDELFPDWRDKRGEGEEFEGLPLRVQARRDRFYALLPGAALRLPTPRQMKNKGNYIISLR
jgi:electron-transferring-flavoprotein dehydrogenase